jgi:hypothetical protein
MIAAALAIAVEAGAQQLVVNPVVQAPWTGFGSDFDPRWFGVTKRIDWPIVDGGGGSGGGIIFTGDLFPPPVPTPIGLLSSKREYSASARAAVQDVVAASRDAYDTDYSGPWAMHAARYAEVLNLQDVLLNQGTAVAEHVSDVTHNSIIGKGRVLAGASLIPDVAGHGDSQSSGISTLDASYRTTAPIWFELTGTLSGAGSLDAAVSLVNDANQALYSFTPNVTDVPTTWAFNVAGVLPPGRYTVSFSASAAAVMNALTSDSGGRGEYALSFVASPRPLGDANGDGAIDRTDIDRWRTSFGYTPNGDQNGDSLIDGADFLRWQTPPPTFWGLLPVPVEGWKLGAWRNGFGLVGRGDVDGDNDADGADFLMWQRKLSAAPPAGQRIPEPKTLLFAVAAVVALAGRRSLTSGAVRRLRAQGIAPDDLRIPHPGRRPANAR